MDFDFTIVNHIQRLEMWASLGLVSGQSAEAIKRTAEAYMAAVFVPVCGAAVQQRGTSGFDPDGFMLQTGSFRFAAREDIECIIVSGWLPEHHSAEVEIRLECRGAVQAERFRPGTLFSLSLDVAIRKGEEDSVRIALSSAYQPSSVIAGSPDTRNLGCIVQAAEFRSTASISA